MRQTFEIDRIFTAQTGASSGGQRQRALGRCDCSRIDFFLMDEPLSNLDAKLRQMRTKIIQLHKRLGHNTIYVTDDQTEAMTMDHESSTCEMGTFNKWEHRKK